MTAQQVMTIVNKITIKRDRQKAALQSTETELQHWEAELEKLKKGGK